jgi:hypothetical protein
MKSTPLSLSAKKPLPLLSLNLNNKPTMIGNNKLHQFREIEQQLIGDKQNQVLELMEK